MSVTSPALRYHGAKFRLAEWIIPFLPNHKVYVEPFGGAAGVLLQKPRSYSEVYNDLDGEIVNFFKVLRDPDLRSELIDQLYLTPFSREEFDLSWEKHQDPVEQARRTAIRAHMGFGSAGATKGSTGFRIDCHRDYGTAMHLWSRYPPAIEAAGRRFTGVLIENRPAERVIQSHDSAETLFFLDPPYLLETRVAKKHGAYRHEMSNDDHELFLGQAKKIQGMAVVCGYDHPLYHDVLQGWTFHSKPSRISSNRGTSVKNECIWLNPACSEKLNYDLFSQPSVSSEVPEEEPSKAFDESKPTATQIRNSILSGWAYNGDGIFSKGRFIGFFSKSGFIKY